MSRRIQLTGVSLDRDYVPVLSGIHLTVRAGEGLALVGPNGAGKTTLLRLMGQLLRPTEGEISYYDPRGEPLHPHRFRRHLGLVMDQTYLYPRLSAEENLLFWARLYQVPKARERIAELLERVDLASAAQMEVGHYSKGMRQRLSIARALLHQPTVLLMDEPFDGLDQHSSQVIQEMLREIVTQGCTLVMVTHHLPWARELCKRVALIVHGKVAAEERVEDLDPVFWDTGYAGLIDGSRGAQKR